MGGSGGDIPAAIPAPPRQFVHFLPWLQISTISFWAASGLCPLPGPALTRRDRGPSCLASSDFGSNTAFNPASAKKPWGAGKKCESLEGRPDLQAPRSSPCRSPSLGRHIVLIKIYCSHPRI